MSDEEFAEQVMKAFIEGDELYRSLKAKKEKGFRYREEEMRVGHWIT
jgi:hypothetical protein